MKQRLSLAIKEKLYDRQLTIVLVRNAIYTLRIPDDIDLKVHLDNSTIDYEADPSRKTELSVYSPHVNYVGNSCYNDGHWGYRTYGEVNDPRTHLQTNGFVMLPHP